MELGHHLELEVSLPWLDPLWLLTLTFTLLDGDVSGGECYLFFHVKILRSERSTCEVTFEFFLILNLLLFVVEHLSVPLLLQLIDQNLECLVGLILVLTNHHLALTCSCDLIDLSPRSDFDLLEEPSDSFRH